MQDINLIRKMAWKFSQKSNIEYEELFSEAALAYCEATVKFDPDNGAKLTTFATTCIHNHLVNFCKRESQINAQNLFYDEFPDYLHPVQEFENEFNFAEYTSGWSDECRVIASIILDDPEKILGETPNFKRSGGKKERLKKELRRQGWIYKEIQEALSEMKTLILV